MMKPPFPLGMTLILQGILFLGILHPVFSQEESLLFASSDTLMVTAIQSKTGKGCFVSQKPFFTVLLDNTLSVPLRQEGIMAPIQDLPLDFLIGGSILGRISQKDTVAGLLCYHIRFTNHDTCAHSLENLAPFGKDPSHAFITAEGTKQWPDYLCRSKLYRPGYGPVGVILPDNAWHMGFCDFPLNDTLSLVATSRRSGRDTLRAKSDRWKTSLEPGGWVDYTVWIETHPGKWHQGVKRVFQERWIYDLPQFDPTMFNREDLSWMRHTYLMLLQFAWDKEYYTRKNATYSFYQTLFQYDALTGGYDIFTLWPTWPRLGLDQRNQWDMYRDLPGGLDALRKQADFTHSHGKRYFISYNPWDDSGRPEDHFSGLEELLRAIDADGVVLDTRGASSYALQATADRVKPGIIMYSEGMAVPKDMPGIVSGRVHDALVLPPPVNLNKLITPGFAIFRVLQLADDRIHREIACAFFNGYGVEINTMRPGRPDWIKEEYTYLGQALKILRENTSVFHNEQFEPLIDTQSDSLYVNGWTNGEKWLYTILSMHPDGHQGPLFSIQTPADTTPDRHLVDLWNHVEIIPVEEDGRWTIPVDIKPFPASWKHTRREGNAGCVGLFPSSLLIEVHPFFISVSASTGDRIIITPGDPSYAAPSHEYSLQEGERPIVFGLTDSLYRVPGKVVIQLFAGTELLDERIVIPEECLPRRIDHDAKTEERETPPLGMVEIPAGVLPFYTTRDPSSLEPFIPLPDHRDTLVISMPRFFMDRYPVTNRQWEQFVADSKYLPADTTNYLRHWSDGKPTQGSENEPVVWVSPTDVLAYAMWANKRLPTEREWQYAAQGSGMRKYPWGDTLDSLKCNAFTNHIATVDSHPGGASPFGVEDMIGNVWQMMADTYDNGSYTYIIIRGGSYYHPASSIWYVRGGPVPADHPELLLLTGEGLNRNATVGFRLVSDAVNK